jgi:hypothetical protein
MKKYFALLACIGFASCTTPGDPGDTLKPVAAMYFFPETNGLQYTYSLDGQNTSDTSVYQIEVPSTLDDRYSKLVGRADGTPTTDTLYEFKTSFNRDGILECVITKQSGGAEDIIALQGELAVGNSWRANGSGSITAIVEDHYDFYYLIGRQRKYDDVVVVKYIDSREAEGTYILRYFANGYGLIHEKRIMDNGDDPTTEVSNLRLLDRKTSGGEIVPRLPDHWWDAHGRYGIVPASPSEELD